MTHGKRVENRALWASLDLSEFILVAKITAFVRSNSAAVFVDALESVVHVAAVVFSLYAFA